jgi:hypothetical protein
MRWFLNWKKAHQLGGLGVLLRLASAALVCAGFAVGFVAAVSHANSPLSAVQFAQSYQAYGTAILKTVSRTSVATE